MICVRGVKDVVCEMICGKEEEEGGRRRRRRRRKKIIGPDNPTCEQLRKIEAAGVKCGRVSMGKRQARQI